MIAAAAINANPYLAVYGWLFFAFYYGKACGQDLG